ncbi:MAG: glycosyltransferase [Alphaproteobacteria bacterium]|nr:glycosyltransferase [Alphaproteobacteria bacterium]MBN2675135.1 glycosyltransferase [Alphaproteobacteria bacterium]
MSNINPISRTYIINKLIFDNNLCSYLEIGVSNPYANFLSISCEKKVSVDPCLECEYFPKETIEGFKPFITHQTTSDSFFKNNHESFDIVFIDGDHSFKQSLKDLNNALKIIPVGGFVILHDAMPNDYDCTQIINFNNKLPYNGEVWKTVISAISAAGKNLQIGTFPYDFGVTVIKKLSNKVPEIKALDLEYYNDFIIPALNPVYDFKEFCNIKVSYFTGLFNTPQKVIERTTRSVLNQTNQNWEWVLHDDSNNDLDAKRLEKFFNSLNDKRIKYFRFNKQCNGVVGMSKKRAANLCTGDYLAELDHDDLLMPGITDKILKHGDGFDFIYSNNASVFVNDDETFSQGEFFGPGFSMGYGAYRKTKDINPLTGNIYEYQECIACPINPKTIRHIVSIPNHIRIWNKDFYDSIGGHNPNMSVADDYELVIRSFLAGGKFLHLDFLGYLQVEDSKRTTYSRNREIQFLWNSVLAANDEKIKKEFELRNIEDWAHNYMKKKIGFKSNFGKTLSIYRYYDVPSIIGTESANYKI